ncbi:hypothetical protein TeGR_g14049 [Tetraparma gracilis]|uniref:Selenide, water dikinase n=1 Tax=Tetraparma gracilis TaxID=2962635 RepID=A0ABQ6MVS3_9STRA|nr:hypothetical protein TeGR_g14049 [Tetraparma gracilis]
MEPPVPTYSDLVLVGGGHAHVHLLKMYGMPPLKAKLRGVRLTLVTRDVLTPYSGMLPGFVSGHYAFQECHLDLAKLCAFSGFRLVHAPAAGITLDDPARGSGPGLVHFSCGRPAVRFDVLSVDVGSAPGGFLPGPQAPPVTPVKPIDSFGARFRQLLARMQAAYKKPAGEGCEPAPFRVVVVGGGAGGIELTLALQHRLSAELSSLSQDPSLLSVSLVNRSPSILNQHNADVRRIFDRILNERGVHLYKGRTATSTHSSSSGQKLLKLSDATLLPFDECVWCTNAAAAPWLSSSTPCETDPAGFLLVNGSFQTSVPSIFAAGDCSHNPASPRPKAGVFAVRAGPPLRDNLVSFLLGEPLEAFELQTEFLGLISTGGKHAVASRGQHALEGKFLWELKDKIDRTWMEGYQILPEMEEEEIATPAIVSASGPAAMLAFQAAPMRCGGCGAKVGASVLSRALKRVRARSASLYPDSPILSADDLDDCAICPPPPNPNSRTVHTIDFFRSFVSDPFVFGKIAAVHALSDCHAMGAVATTALALAVCLYAANESITEDTLFHMLAGATDALQEDGCRLVGGHTCEGAELGLGFAVNGYLDEGQVVMKKLGGKVGDKIVLTKPIGTGACFASEMRGKCSGADRAEALASMVNSNGRASRVLVDPSLGATSATDVTGFGMMGHLLEMLGAPSSPSGGVVGANLFLDKVPFLRGGIAAAEQDIFSSLQKDNARVRRAVSNHKQVAGELGSDVANKYYLLFDPQTSGGLLVTVDADTAEEMVGRMREQGYPQADIVGELVEVAAPPPSTSPDVYNETSPAHASLTASVVIPYAGDWTLEVTQGTYNVQHFLGSPRLITVKASYRQIIRGDDPELAKALDAADGVLSPESIAIRRSLIVLDMTVCDVGIRGFFVEDLPSILLNSAVMVAALKAVSKERQDELKEVMIDSKEIKVEKMLGKGGFGVVNLAIYRGGKVAMKQVLE